MSRSNIFLLLATILVIHFADGKSTHTSVVQTNKGPVRGEILKTVLNSKEYAAFKGIPYAEPPVGDKRFRPPEEKKPWANLLDATSEGNVCPQVDLLGSLSLVGSEDCLYLNVFTPHTNFNKSKSIPVMVWIHGGAFIGGDSNAATYGPDFLLEEDVIVVSLNYRLGALGFLNLNHEKATGNMGLKDQNLALKWVSENIAKFGGNPNKVTLFGQSAGSASVDLQVLSDLSAGFFQQSISMSGSTLGIYWGFQRSTEAEEKAYALGSLLGTHTNDKDVLLQKLYNATAAEIVVATTAMGGIAFRPSLEHSDIASEEVKFLTTCSVKKYLAGNYTKGPHIVGSTANETLAFASNMDYMLTEANNTLQAISSVTSLDNIPFLSNVVSAVTSEPASFSEDDIYQLIQDTSDILFFTGIDTKQQLLSLNNNHPIYYYQFVFESNKSHHEIAGYDIKGVAHSDDLPYLFYMPYFGLPLDESKVSLTRNRLVRLWTNFAKYGNPTPQGSSDILDVKWIDSRINGDHLRIDEDLSIESRPTDSSVKNLQLVGLGASLALNQCT